MTGLELEPAILCLMASLLWAPVVYVAATHLDRGRALSTSEVLWIVALAVAALPTLIAPAFAAAGISLRPAPAAFPIAAMPELAAAAATAAPSAHPIAPQVTLGTLFDAAALLYVYGVLLAFGVWLTRCLIFAAHVRRAAPLNHPRLVFALQMWRRRLGVAAPLKVQTSRAVSSVCVYGLFRPVIIVPEDLNARVSFDDLVMMCAHELAHVKRGDCRLFAAGAAARILFWFNPFLKRIASRAELAAEQSADALVLEAGADRRAYAACFVEGLRFAAERAQGTRVAIPSFTPFDKKSRRDRLDAILSGQTEARRTPSRLAIGVAASLAAALAFAQAAFAVYPEAERGPKLNAARMPVEGEVTLPFGAAYKDDSGKELPPHEGVDIKAPLGAPVVAYADGIVIDATDLYKNKTSYGKVVALKHRDGLVTLYAHLDGYSVRKGDRVAKGQRIGVVGATGKVSGPHLHFEALVDGVPVDPTDVGSVEAVVAQPPEPASVFAPLVQLVAPSAPEPATAPEPPVAPDPVTAPAPLPSIAVSPAPLIDGDAPHIIIKRGPGNFETFSVVAPKIHAHADGKDGKRKVVTRNFAWAFSDKDGVALNFDGAMSDKGRKEFDKSMKDMRKQMETAKLAHANALAQMHIDLDGFDFNHLAFDAMNPVDTEKASEAAAKAQENRERIMQALEAAIEEAEADWQLNVWDGLQQQRNNLESARDRMQAAFDREQARREREQALRDQEQALRDQEQAAREIERERREAEREQRDAERQQRDEERAQRDRERAEREAEREQARAEREAERAQREAERAEEMRLAEEERRTAIEEARIERAQALDAARIEWEAALSGAQVDREEMLRLRAEALAEAEQKLNEERAEIERMRAELESRRAESDRKEW